MLKMKVMKVALVSAGLMIGLVSRAKAADVAPAKAPSASEDIIVTAQKRSERLQDVPIAITAVSATALTQNLILKTDDLQFVVPSLVYTVIDGSAEPRIRGIGNSNLQPNVDPSVGTYIDGIYLAGPGGALTDLLGTQRIEVLKGPQGTLYGRNSVGGAVNIYTLTPTQDFDAKLALTGGNYGHVQGNGYVSGGIGDKLSAGIYFAANTIGEYNKQIDDGPSTVDPIKRDGSGAVRAKIVWIPTDWLKLTALAQGSWSASGNDAVFYATDKYTLPLGLAFGATNITGPRTIDVNEPDTFRTRDNLFVLRGDVDLGWAKLASLSGYHKYASSATIDVDGTNADLVNYLDSDNLNRVFSQEVELQSADASKIKWIAGLYFSDEHTGQSSDLTLRPPLTPGPLGQSTRDSIHYDSYAAFAQTTIPLTFISDRLNLTGGIRYTIDHQSFNISSRYAMLDPNGTLGTDIPDTATGAFSSKTWYALTPKITLDYKFTRNAMVYATWAKGYQAGVYNGTSTTNFGPVNPERLNSYEIGTKLTLLDGRVHLDSGAFYYDFSNLQVQANPNPDQPFAVIENAASATYKGVEANVEVRVTRDLSLSVGATYVDAYYNSFPAFAAVVPAAFGNTTINLNAGGSNVERSPRWVTTAGAHYVHEDHFGNTIHANAGWYRNNSFFFQAGDINKQGSYNVLNASIGYTVRRWDLSLWASNLTNAYYFTEDEATAFANLVGLSQPRMFGATLTWKY